MQIKPLMIVVVLLLSCTDDKEFKNPFDPQSELSPDAWAPTNLEVEILNDSQVKLTWVQESDAISGFIINRKVGSANYVELVQLDKNTNDYIDSALTINIDYQYKIMAFADVNQSGSINSDVVSTNFPSPTELTTTVLNNSEILLSWVDNCSFESGYKVQRSLGDGYIQIAELDSNSIAFVDTGLLIDQNYQYQVFAYTEFNESNFSESLNIPFYNDCNGDFGGTATIDDCDVCSGGNTAHIANSDKDCADICFGDSLSDNCEICDSDTSNDCIQDCNGVWGGTAIENECGCVEGNTDLATDYCYGCTDSSFENYNSQATIDDGSCSSWGGTMVSLTGGSFEMGDIWNVGNSNELPTHTVTISSFEMSATEITNQQYADYLTEALENGTITANSNAVIGSWQSSSYEFLDIDDYDCKISYSNNAFTVDNGYENHPVVEVSWYGATGFAEHYGYRLPTEAEWEFAARGISANEDHKWSGTSTESELTNYAWYSSNNSPSGTKEVGTKLPNGNGLYDMSGNVWEWVADWYDNSYYNNSPSSNPQGPNSGSYRVLRGGYYYNNATYLRSSDRYFDGPNNTYSSIGFRISRTN